MSLIVYINTLTGKYPVTEQDIRANNPNVSFSPPFIAPKQYRQVFASKLPDFNPLTQRLAEAAPVISQTGTYERGWTIVDLDPDVAQKNLANRLVNDTARLIAAIKISETVADIKDVYDSIVASGATLPDYGVIRPYALDRLNADYTTAVNFIRADYPEAELITWTMQRTEAKAYLAWENAGSKGTPPDTPFLVQLNAERTAMQVGDGMVDLVNRIINNDAFYTPAMAKLTAMRHGFEKQLNAFTTLEQVASIDWVFPNLVAEAQAAAAAAANPAT
jgi:hypothetical protein